MPAPLPKLHENAKLCWQHRQEFQAMASASVIFIAGGMKFAWCVFEEPPAAPISRLGVQLLVISWFLGAILGSIVSTTCVQKVTKNVALCSGGALLMSGGILFITFPNYTLTLFIGSMLEGCAYGLTQVQSLVTGGEVAHRHLRGLLISSERIFLWFGICVQLLCTRVWYSHYPPAMIRGYTLQVNQMHGIIVACLGFVATILTLLHRVESPLLLKTAVQQVECGGVVVAKETQPLRETGEIQCKSPAVAGAPAPCSRLYLLPLLKLTVMRCFVGISMSLAFNRAFLTSSWNGFSCDMNCLYILGACGFLGSIVGGLLVDAHGRRQLSVSALLSSGILIFVVGGIFEHLQHSQTVLNRFDLEMAAFLLLLFQFVTCLGVGVVSSVYLSEAFEGSFKAKCIAAVLCAENMLQICLSLLVLRMEYSNAALFFSIGSLNLLFGILAFFCMPETKFLTLRECLVKFNKCS